MQSLQRTLRRTVAALGISALLLVAGTLVVRAGWLVPPVPAPTGNPDVPLTVSGSEESKKAGLTLNQNLGDVGLIVYGDATHGLVGIGTGAFSLSQKLEVVGNIFVRDNLKANGDAGTPDQVLAKGGLNAMSWQDRSSWMTTLGTLATGGTCVSNAPSCALYGYSEYATHCLTDNGASYQIRICHKNF
jgi:hypothetical protein